jgi:hypothetical protein
MADLLVQRGGSVYLLRNTSPGGDEDFSLGRDA